jgi:hypothetical protein
MGSKMQEADFISRIVDYDDWGVSDEIFIHLDSLWGPHEIDWFANYNNHKLPVFYSRYWTINAIGIDAFTVNWNGVNKNIFKNKNYIITKSISSYTQN